MRQKLYCTHCGQILRHAAPAHPDRGGSGDGECGDCTVAAMFDIFGSENLYEQRGEE